MLPFPALLLLLFWLLTMISLPIVGRVGSQALFDGGVSLGVLLQLVTVLTIWARQRGWAAVLKSAGGIVVMAWLVEFIGSSTGLPFGRYGYTGRLQPQLGHVPLLIPLAWLMMLPPAWAVTRLLLPKTNGWRFGLLAAMAFTAWDLFLDPQMVAWGYWQWDHPAGYFGIPWLNFGGWLLTSALITMAIRPEQLPLPALWLIYTLTWGLESIGQLFFWGLPGPALVGFFGMGLFVIASWRQK